MNLIEEIKKIAREIPTVVQEKNGAYVIEFLIAERKSFLLKQRLVYRAKFRIDEEKKEIRFSERLKESGFGISSENNFGSGISPGLGFKKETYSVGLSGEREGIIQEQSNLFRKKYNYKFDFGSFRKKIEEKAKGAGYQFNYKITDWGV